VDDEKASFYFVSEVLPFEVDNAEGAEIESKNYWEASDNLLLFANGVKEECLDDEIHKNFTPWKLIEDMKEKFA